VKQTSDVENDMHKTTVMLRNMPNNYNRDLLLELLDREGFACQYDFIYLPIDFESRACKGYAFINLRDPATALRFFRTFEGYTKWAMPSRKASGVSWSGTQGLQTHIDRYRNSSIMKAPTPDEYKPAIFVNGIRAPFPASTRRERRS
jgi:RNA recognition motif-containing protein